MGTTVESLLGLAPAEEHRHRHGYGDRRRGSPAEDILGVGLSELHPHLVGELLGELMESDGVAVEALLGDPRVESCDQCPCSSNSVARYDGFLMLFHVSIVTPS